MPLIRSNVSPRLFPLLFFAGRAIFTLHNRQANTHCTLKVTQLKDKQDRKKLLPIFYVYISLLGDGETGLRFAATYFQSTGTFKLGRDIKPTDQLAKVMAFAHQALTDTTLLSRRGVSLLHMGKCCRCSLPLTHPESIDVGFGPSCWKTVKDQIPELEADEIFQPLANLA